MEKRYTAQEMRDVADAMSRSCDSDLVVADADECGLHINHDRTFDVASMLRQAAEAEEERDRLDANLDSLKKELSKLRLESLDTLKKFAECANSLQQAHIERDSLRLRLKKVIDEGKRIRHLGETVVGGKVRVYSQLYREISDAVLRAARGNEPPEQAK